jgi:hypothetical protein
MSRRRWWGAIAFSMVGAVEIAACSDNGAVTLAGDGGLPAVDGGVPAGAGVGQPCSDAIACRPGLACNAGTCAPSHAGGDGTPCVISAECKAGDYCSAMRCAPAGMGGDGDACKSDADCKSGFRCDVEGFSLACKPEGMGDVGGACASSADCFGGLLCVNKSCEPAPPGAGGVPPVGVPTWKGADCTDDPGPTQAYFRVPRGTNDGDFYRLPFPNDARLKNGHPDLTGHPSPGSDLLGFDPVDRYLRDVELHTSGFSAYPTIFFRFSASVDFDTLKAMGALRLVDVSAGAGNDLGFYWSATTGRSNYVCNNYMTVRPSVGAPLTPGHTYAMIMTNVVKDAMQKDVTVSSDLAALLASTAPSDAALASAYAAYKPLRDWATMKSFALGSVLNATVFTVGTPTKTPSKLPAAVAAAAAPTATSWVKCGSAPSPCPQATGDRACGAADPTFDELHALVTLPIFQKGSAPYLLPADGGDFDVAADGTPAMQRTEQVCMALTVPKGVTMPTSGWPLVVYAHGTGGSFRSHINEGVAARLANADDGAGGKIHMAVLGIDQVQHGTRRGASTASPNNLFFNFANPLAARGNPLQGAVDQLALVRFAKALDLAANASPTSAEIKFGTIAYWGHSQGATEGGIAMPYAAGVAGAVLSGEGASLIDALVGKKSPVDIADALPIVLVEPHGVDGSHPVLSILQNAIDVADPLNHAAAFFASPFAGATTKHVFQPYGLNDTFAPPASEQVFALAAGLGVAAAPAGVTPDKIGEATPLSVPAGGNITVMGASYTGIVREYAPTGYDGHFVAYKDPTGSSDVDKFLADVVAGKVPKVGR